MKVLITDGISKEGLAILQNAGLEITQQQYPPEELVAVIKDYEAIIVRSATKVTREVIEAGTKLKVIARGGVGLDNIDTAFAKEKGIPVLNTPGASAASVAELAIAHMFAVSRFLHLGSLEMRAGKWPKKEFSKGIELSGKTCGILGFGSIGKEVGKRALGLGMNVVVYDPYFSPAAYEVEQASKEDVLARADFLTLHLPLDKAAGPTIGAAEFAMMKKGVVLVNCARGGVVDEAALLEALENGTVFGAGLDVFASEPPTEAQQALINHPRIAVSPHIGGSTVEGQARVGTEIAEKVAAALTT